MKSKSKIHTRIIAFILCLCLSIGCVPVQAESVLEDLFDFSYFYYHWLNEDGREQYASSYNWGSKDAEENGIRIKKTGIDTIQVTINASVNELYAKAKPVLMWVHKADSLFDATKYTDLEQWYQNKLEETFLIMAIDNPGENVDITINVPMKQNLAMGGLINGGYYEIDFYDEGTIPAALDFAYKAQTYSIDELEEYMDAEMSDTVAEYYNADSGFRSETDGLPFRNADYEGGGGICAGFSSVAAGKYNGVDFVDTIAYEDEKYTLDDTLTWYPYIFGDLSIHDIQFEDSGWLHRNSPMYNKIDETYATSYPYESFNKTYINDVLLVEFLDYYLGKNNMSVALMGNSAPLGMKVQNLDNRWSIIDYIASYLRQGKAITVNLSDPEQGGHAIVGYKMEKIDEDTYRLYCYDCNYPDDMCQRYTEGNTGDKSLNEDGSYKNVVWSPTEVYIDFTRKTITGYASSFQQREKEVFTFDSTHTSFPTNSEKGLIAFSYCKGDSVGVFNYGNDSNEIINYKAFPVIENDTSVKIRTFAFYKSGEVREITDSINTQVHMDFSYIGWYKLKDSTITLTKSDYAFSDNGTSYVECSVTYDNIGNEYGKVKVRIPVVKK